MAVLEVDGQGNTVVQGRVVMDLADFALINGQETRAFLGARARMRPTHSPTWPTRRSPAVPLSGRSSQPAARHLHPSQLLDSCRPRTPSHARARHAPQSRATSSSRKWWAAPSCW